jgi:uncharacterized membrane protein
VLLTSTSGNSPLDIRGTARQHHRMLRTAAFLPIVLAAACGAASSDTAASDAATPATTPPAAAATAAAAGGGPDWTYWRCPTMPIATRSVGDRGLELRVGLSTRRLSPTPSPSGARYDDGIYSVWTTGDEATLGVEDHSETCPRVDDPDPWLRAAAEGVTFRAIGQEPGWVFHRFGDRGFLVAFANGDTVQTPVPREERTPAAGTTRWDARTEAHHLVVTIAPTPCTDTISGEAFPSTLTLEVDGKLLRGCGRPLP